MHGSTTPPPVSHPASSRRGGWAVEPPFFAHPFFRPFLSLSPSASPSATMALDQATNPFAAARAALVSQFFVTPPPSFRPMVFALSAVHAVTLLVTLAALLLRWRAGTKGDCFWFIRIVATEHGRFIHPNPITLWLVCSSLFLAGAYHSALSVAQEPSC